MATRYTDKQKKDVVAFVKKHDAEHGRGGQSAAKKKYGINPISIKKWCVEQGYGGTAGKKKKAPAKAKAPKAKTTKAAAKPAAKAKTKRTAKKKTARGRKAAATTVTIASPAKTSSSTAATLRKMSTIADKIDSLHAEFEALKKSL